MTEIKIAQGAKQTGGKIIGSKVSEDIAYYRGVEPGKDLISPNRFPFAKTIEEIFDFVFNLHELPNKPIGIKIVISNIHDVEKLVIITKDRLDKGIAIPDFITPDGGDGGSATAPLELMESVGLTVTNTLFIIDTLLNKHRLKEHIRLVASGKVLTPDDVAILLCMGADLVGMATRDKRKHLSYLLIQKSHHIANYHNNLIKGLRTVMSVMGVANVHKLSKTNVAFKNKQGEIFLMWISITIKKFNI